MDNPYVIPLVHGHATEQTIQLSGNGFGQAGSTSETGT
jgi:hypothetical protein